MPIMPRIRTVKPELFMHEGLFDLAQKHQLPLQLAFIGVILCCDKEGRFCWELRRLKATILPYYDVDMSEVLEIFVTHGFIRKYEHQGLWYGCIPSWSKHQVINNEKKSILPAPPGDTHWAKPQPQKTHSECHDLKNYETVKQNFEGENVKSEDAFLQPFLAMPPPEIENKNLIKNNELQDEKSPAPRACTRRSRAWKEGKGKEMKGREEKGTEEQEQNIVGPMTQPVIEDPVSLIFNHWRTVMEHPGAKLDRQRKSMIEHALKLQYSVEELCQAIKGCSVTPHNRGQNDRGERYDGLHIIFRDCEQIDRFMRNCEKPPRVKTESEIRSESNIHTLQGWIDRKMQEERAYANA